jgi:hypothetical protein
VSLLVASFTAGEFLTWALPLAITAGVWTFVFLVLGGRGKGK